MRGSAHVTGPLGSRHGSERVAYRAGPAWGPPPVGRQRGSSGPLLLLGKLPPWPENAAAFATSCLCVTGDATFLLDLPQRGGGPFKLPQRRHTPPCAAPEGAPSAMGAAGRGRREATPDRSTRGRALRPARWWPRAPMKNSASATAQAADPPSAPHTAPEATTSDLRQGPVCICLPNALVAFSNNTQPNGKAGAFSVSCASGLSLTGH